MEIGDVLLRDTQYVWRKRKALIVKDAVVLQVPTETQPRETFSLDGRFTCEAVVVSSAHLHSVRLHDIHTGAEYLLDTRSRGKKQVWVEIFKNVRRLDAFQPIMSTRRIALNTIAASSSLASSSTTDPAAVKELQEVVRKSTLQTAVGKIIRGSDLGNLLHDDKNVDWIGDQLLQVGALESCCCSCEQFSNGEYLYRVDQDVVNNMVAKDTFVPRSRRHRNRYHRSKPCLLNPVFERVLKQFEHVDALTGLEIVQTCVRNGIFNVPTAIAVANEMLQRELIHSSGDPSEESESFAMDAVTKYAASRPLTVANAVDGKQTLEPQSEDFARFFEEYRVLKERYDLMFYVLGVFCILVLFDGWGSALPGSVKLAVVAGLLAWLTLGDGSATLHINIKKRSQSGQRRIVTAAFVSSLGATPTRGVHAAGLPNMKAIDPPALSDAQLIKRASSEDPRVAKSEPQFDQEMKAVQPVPSDQLVAEAKAKEARVHSFRLAIAQAASMAYEATQVYTDDYLFSVMSVKDRAFGYAVTKIAKCLEWRAQYGVDAITHEDVKAQLVSGSMYWYGYDFENRPILWVRATLKDWKNMSQRREAEIKAHIYLIEAGSRQLMPPGCTTYTVVTDSAKMGPSHVDLRLMHGLLDTCVANYPDRIGMVHAGPMTRFLTWATPMLWPFLPVRLRHKVSFMHDCVKELSKYMKTELIPKHMGGTADHILRPTPSSDPNEALDVLYMIEQQKLRMKEISN